MDERRGFEHDLSVALHQLVGPAPEIDPMAVVRAATVRSPRRTSTHSTPASKGFIKLITVPRVVAASILMMALLGALLTGSVPTSQSPAATLEPTSPTRSQAVSLIEWESGGIGLTADTVTLTIGPTVVSPSGEVLTLGTTYADQGDLEAWWYENGSVQRLLFQLDLDGTNWWIDSIRAYDGHGDDSEWIYFEGLEDRTRTPLGEPIEGDLHLESTRAYREAYEAQGAVVLDLTGLRFSAFTPGTRPAPLAGCSYVEDDGVHVEWDEYDDGGGYWSAGYEDGVLQGRGEPLRNYAKKSPKRVEAALQRAGLCYRFDHSWPTTPRFEDERLDRQLEGYFDRRCSAPETGRVGELSFGVDHPSGGPGIIIYIEVRETEPRDWPEPPPYGTDCPSQ